MTYDDVLKEPSREYELEDIIEDLIFAINDADKVETILNSDAYKRAVEAVGWSDGYRRENYFKTLIAIYLYEATGKIPKENLLKNIMENIRKQAAISEETDK